MKTYQILVALLMAVLPLTPGKAANFTGMVVFGDSLSDLGNTYDKFGDLAPLVLFGEEGYNTNFYNVGRWSNGPVWVEYLNDRLNLPLLEKNNGTDLNGTNFAYAGTTSGTGYTSDVLPNLLTQVSSYVGLLQGGTSTMPAIATTLFTLWAGGNDIIYALDDAPPAPPAPLPTPLTPGELVANISASITSLYNAGGRYFLVPNLPPLGEKPNWLNDPVKHTLADEFVALYNPLLEDTLNTLSADLDDIFIVQFDVLSLFNDVLADPAAFGIANVTDPAYKANLIPFDFGTVEPDPNSYLFWDTTHPTMAGHVLVGEGAYDALATIPEPTVVTLIALGSGCILFAARRRLVRSR